MHTINKAEMQYADIAGIKHEELPVAIVFYGKILGGDEDLNEAKEEKPLTNGIY